MNEWIITIKKEYADAILESKKKIEVRTRIPASLSCGDLVFVHVGGTGDRVDFAFFVESIISYSPMGLYSRHRKCLCIDLSDYLKYTEGRRTVFAIGIGTVIKYGTMLTIKSLGVLHAPQWFTRVPKLNKKNMQNCTTGYVRNNPPLGTADA